MDITVDRVLGLIRKEGLSYSDFGKKCGFTRGAVVTNWIKRDYVPIESIRKIADAFPAYSYEWLAGETLTSPSDRENYLTVQLYTAKYEEGVTSFVKSADTSPIVRKQVLPADGQFYALAVEDNALAPDLTTGDLIVFNRDDRTVVDGAIFVVWLNKRIFIRKVFKSIDGISLKSESKKIEDIHVPDEMLEDGTCQIAGRVVWRGGSC